MIGIIEVLDSSAWRRNKECYRSHTTPNSYESLRMIVRLQHKSGDSGRAIQHCAHL
jgi:hypothetical protein